MRPLFQLQWFGMYELYSLFLTRPPGFLLQNCRCLFLGLRVLSWVPIRSRQCCEEPGMVLVWIVISTTVTKVVEGCVYLRRRCYGILFMMSGREFEHSALCSASLSLLSPLIHLLEIHSSDRAAVRAFGLRLYEHMKLVELSISTIS